MTTRLDKPLKRELLIAGHPYVLTVSPLGLKLVPKGKRNGYELDWKSFVSGDAALAAALNAALTKAPAPPATTPTANTAATKNVKRPRKTQPSR